MQAAETTNITAEGPQPQLAGQLDPHAAASRP